MKRIFLLMFFLLIMPAEIFGDDPDQRIQRQQLPRFQLHYGAVGTWSPWEQYNSALETVTERIRYDPAFINPQGSYEKIRGDLRQQSGLRVRIFRGLYAGLDYQWGSTAARFHFFPNLEGTRFSSPAFDQHIELNTWAVGVGLTYLKTIGSRFNLMLSFFRDRYDHKLALNWQSDRFASGEMPADEGNYLSVDFATQQWTARFNFSAGIKLWGPLRLITGVQYRRLKWTDIEGQATYRPGYTPQEDYFPVRLVHKFNYFGVEQTAPGEITGFDYDQIFNDLAFRTENYPQSRENLQPATLDLSGWGLKTSIEVGF